MWFQGLNAAPAELQDIPRRWGEMNPGYSVKIWDEARILQFIGQTYSKLFRFFCDIGKGENERVATIKKCDFARLLILHAFGGAYIDLDCLPLKPINSLWDSSQVAHRFTPFIYSRNSSHPSILQDKDAQPQIVDFYQYEMIFSREHCPNEELQGYPIANTVMWGKKGAPLMMEIVSQVMQNAGEKVLGFAGPLAISRYLKSKVKTLSGRALTLPPYYFLWQKHDMGPAWKHTICYHLNRMDWADKDALVPWDC